MPTYICLARWTSKGLGDIKESPSRLDAARKLFQSWGLILKHCCPRRDRTVAWSAENTRLGGTSVDYLGGGLRFEVLWPVQVIPKPGRVVRQPGSGVECPWDYQSTESIRDR